MDTRTRCDWSDLHTDECGHCRGGDDGTPGVFLADPPPRPARTPTRLAPRIVKTAPAPIPSPLTAAYPLLCVNPDCRPNTGPRRAAGRSHVCPQCEDTARDNLARTAAAWLDVRAALTQLRVLAAVGPVTGTRARGIVLNEAASAAAAAATDLALWYTRLTIRERGHTPARTDTPGLLRWLARTQVPWLTGHPDQGVAAAFTTDTADVRRRCEAAAYPAGWRTIPLPVGCDVQVPVDGDCEGSPGGPCPGRLTARIRPDLGRMPDLVCDADAGHVVPPSVWQRPGWKHAALREDAVRAFLGRLRPRHADSDG